jgi:HEPN domain-containing protein
MSSPKLRDETQRWLQFARQDIADAEALLRESSHFRNTCFLAQQCAEKALKATLIWDGLDVPFRHDLEHLIGLVPVGWNVPDTNWPALTAWATTGRYPSELTEPDAALAGELLSQACAVLEAIELEFSHRAL